MEEKSIAPRRGMGPLRPEVVNTGEERGVQYVKPGCRVKVRINLFIFRAYHVCILLRGHGNSLVPRLLPMYGEGPGYRQHGNLTVICN